MRRSHGVDKATVYRRFKEAESSPSFAKMEQKVPLLQQQVRQEPAVELKEEVLEGCEGWVQGRNYRRDIVLTLFQAETLGNA